MFPSLGEISRRGLFCWSSHLKALLSQFSRVNGKNGFQLVHNMVQLKPQAGTTGLLASLACPDLTSAEPRGETDNGIDFITAKESCYKFYKKPLSRPPKRTVLPRMRTNFAFSYLSWRTRRHSHTHLALLKPNWWSAWWVTQRIQFCSVSCVEDLRPCLSGAWRMRKII